MKDIKENDIIEAIITGIQNYGAFVKVKDDCDGLIHISEISYGYVKNVNDFIKIGDKIYAKVIGIDKDTGKINLSIKDNYDVSNVVYYVNDKVISTFNIK